MQDHKEEQPSSNWRFNYGEAGSAGNSVSDAEKIEWTAQEFIEQDKNKGWYILLALGGVAFSILVYLLTRDTISLVFLLIVTVIFGVAASRRPQEVNYSLDSTGLRIGQKLYPYHGFKSFSVVDEGGVESIWLMPLKRFMPIVPLYFKPGDGEKIVNALANLLPHENRQPDIIDRLMQRLHF